MVAAAGSGSLLAAPIPRLSAGQRSFYESVQPELERNLDRALHRHVALHGRLEEPLASSLQGRHFEQLDRVALRHAGLDDPAVRADPDPHDHLAFGDRSTTMRLSLGRARGAPP
jgi:hypothetical protein